MDPLEGQELALPFAYRYGHTGRRPHTMAGDRRLYRPYMSARYDQFVRVEHIDPTLMLPERRLALATTVPIDWPPTEAFWPIGEEKSLTTIPALTYVRCQEPSYGYAGDDGFAPEYEQHDEAYYHRIVVLGGAGGLALRAGN